MIVLLPLFAACLIVAACGSSDPSSSPSPTTSDASDGTSCGTIDEVPFANQLTFPPDLPKGLRLANACWSESSQTQIASLFYGTEDDQGMLVVSILSGSGIPPIEQEDRSTVQLDGVVGYVSNEPEPDGTSFYLIQFEKDGRNYGVAANLGDTNLVTTQDVDTVARSIAEN